MTQSTEYVRCCECAEAEAKVRVFAKAEGGEVLLGAVCSPHCRSILIERAERWPDTYIKAKVQAAKVCDPCLCVHPTKRCAEDI